MLTLPRSATDDEDGCDDDQVPPRRAAPASPTCEIRILESPTEVEASLRLRYEVHHRLGYVADCASRLDVDEYDAYAIPLGAVDRGTRGVMGTLRVLTTTPQPHYGAIVARLVAQTRNINLGKRAGQPRLATLPSLASDEICRRAATAAAGLPVYELSRCIVRPDRRGLGVSRRIIELGMAVAWSAGPALLIGGCLPEHVPMYARYGFRGLHEATDYLAYVGRDAYVIACVPNDVPAPTRARIDLLIEDLRARETP